MDGGGEIGNGGISGGEGARRLLRGGGIGPEQI